MFYKNSLQRLIRLLFCDPVMLDCVLWWTMLLADVFTPSACLLEPIYLFIK